MQDLVLRLEDLNAADPKHVGGKAATLGKLLQHGFPVPPGFVISVAALRALDEGGSTAHPDLQEATLTAYQQLPDDCVAVRSSSAHEDGKHTSFAGQLETLLAVRGDAPLLDAIHHCWQSWHSARNRDYRQQHGLADMDPAMAVLVQVFISAEVSGVIFTRDPLHPDRNDCIIEAAQGPGESVVRGSVSPDRFRIDRSTRAILERSQIANDEQGTVGTALDDEAIRNLVDLALRVEAEQGSPQDIEWALAGGKIYLLQSRPITTLAADRDRERATIIRVLEATADPAGTVWAQDYMMEALPDPTPMTWGILQRLLAADGGLGSLYRDLGYDPDPSLQNHGAYDLIAGRPMLNLTRSPRMQFRRPPYRYPLEVLKARSPKDTLQPVLMPMAEGLWAFPGMLWRLWRGSRRTRRIMAGFADTFRQQVIPRFVHQLAQVQSRPLSALSDDELLAFLHEQAEWCLVEFARESLKPTLFAEQSWSEIQAWLGERIPAAEMASIMPRLVMGVTPDPEADLTHGLEQFRLGHWDRARFLAQFGHRGHQEMELAQPRWRETPEVMDTLLSPCGHLPEKRPSQTTTLELGQSLGIAGKDLALFRQKVEQLQTWIALRETAKHYFLLGYAFLREILLEWDRRYDLHGQVFLLTPAELPQLKQDRPACMERAHQRRRQRQVQRTLYVPPVLFSDSLMALGDPPPGEQASAESVGVAISPGYAEGPALVLTEPILPRGQAPGFILICPSADPAWVPIFSQAQGIVFALGGILSHGAIVAREFGLPAVGGFPDILSTIRTGERIRVDGSTGRVTRLELGMKSS